MQTRRVALFPLNVVLFPGGLLPLRIFEPRYLRMVSECLRESAPFAVASIVDGPEAGGVATASSTGTLASIVDWSQGDDGLLELVCVGEQRVELGAITAEADQLLRADATPLAAPTPRPLPDELAWTAALLDELLERLGAPYDDLRQSDPSADHVANRLTELLPIPLQLKQALFDECDSVQRLHRLAELIELPRT